MTKTIPVIDLGRLDTPSGLAELDRACAEWGFFYLTGHDIDLARADGIIAAARSFFALPAEDKNKIRRSDENSWGYYDAELTKNRRDWKEILDIGPEVTQGPLAGSTPQWPDLPRFQETMETCSESFHSIALSLVGRIAEALGSGDDLLAPFENHSSYLRLNYYPECHDPAPDNSGFEPEFGQLGISHHSDAGAVTVLLQDDIPGLQVFRDGSFHTIEPMRGTLIINVGDIVQVWSNDRYRAPLHRVLANSIESRISLPYFLNPDYGYDYAPLASVLGEGSAARYRPINWGEFRSRRSAGDYQDVGKEVQISDYAIGD